MSEPDVIFAIVEGHGEEKAIRRLLERIIYERLETSWPGSIIPMNAKGQGTLTKALEYYLERARSRGKSCKGVLVLRDAEGECPSELAYDFATRAKKLGLPFPVVIVFANCEYESWFLASLHTILNKPSVTFDSDPEQKCNAKEWLDGQLPDGYKETIHQVRMTTKLDIPKVIERCRSFRRLVHAVEELLAAIDAGRADVTPLPATPLPAS